MNTSLAVKNIFLNQAPDKKTGTISSINGLNATIIEPSGNTLNILLINTSFKNGDTVLCINGVVQRTIKDQKSPIVIRI